MLLFLREIFSASLFLFVLIVIVGVKFFELHPSLLAKFDLRLFDLLFARPLIEQTFVFSDSNFAKVVVQLWLGQVSHLVLIILMILFPPSAKLRGVVVELLPTLFSQVTPSAILVIFGFIHKLIKVLNQRKYL